MKKTLCLLLALSLVIAALVPAMAEGNVFTGTARGMQGDVVVNVTIEDGKITDIQYEKYPETENITYVARDRIPAQIIEHQTLAVDSVTGATFASYAIVGAVKNAVKASGQEIAALTAEAWHEPAGPDETWDADVLVMGGGGAGLAAAITAAQNGAKVILIEKSSVMGGNTMVAGAAYNCVDPEAQSTAILTPAQKSTMDSYLALSEDDPSLSFDVYPEWKEVLAQLKEDINAFYAANEGKTPGVDMPGFDSIALHMWHCYTGGKREMLDGSLIAPKIELARTLAESALGSFEWMGSIGLNAGYGAGARLSTVLGAMWPRTHSFMSGADRIPQLVKVAEETGVKIYTETRGTELLVSDNRVVGAKAETVNGTKITINTAKGVILATGGYCANPKMVKQYDKYWGDDLTEYTLSTNLGTNEGDGIIMATAIGADTFGMGVAQMMPSSSPVKGTMTDGIWGDAAEQIWIDGNGDRFVNEYAERDVLAKASLALDKGIFYIIYAGRGDITKPDVKLTGVAYDPRTASMVEGGHIWYAPTLKDMAEATKTAAAGCAPAFTEEKLRETIEKYNQYVANQKDDDFGKEVLAGAIDIEALEADPNLGFCISPRKASLHHTMGGICIDTHARVLREDGSVIEGLWAAGEVTGGIHAGNRLGGNAIADIFTFGRIAGNEATAK
ncbi:MAG: FAD-dependent oxidoreductase [Clostridia bacterium]|nr:FAD-dependent oxidoreductase [Clostridia bacterium]MBQ6232012.1 FAD-dependent oxidoreductase [Clostridia bacterium]